MGQLASHLTTYLNQVNARRAERELCRKLPNTMGGVGLTYTLNQNLQEGGMGAFSPPGRLFGSYTLTV